MSRAGVTGNLLRHPGPPKMLKDVGKVVIDDPRLSVVLDPHVAHRGR